MEPYKILFVCMGNICRSPAGEGVLLKMLEDADVRNGVEIDSAGTIGFHANSPADARMQEAASKRGYDLQSRSRKVTASDFEQFDLILAMDFDNQRDLEALRPSDNCRAELKLFCSYCDYFKLKEVPDPYYGGAKGFENVLDIIEDGCKQLVEEVREKVGSSS